MIYNRHLIAVLICLLSVNSPNAQSTSNQNTVAVLDFEARGIAVYEAETLTERLRSEIPNTNAFRLVDRKLLETILEEQGLQQSGCTTDECAAEVGQLLGVQFMISGSIGKLDNLYTIDLKLVSVTTGATERVKTLSYEGQISDLIIEMEILAWEIVGLNAPPSLLANRKAKSEVDDKVTLAVLDFEPRGISNLESQTLTDRFSTEVNNTGKAILVDRNSMNEVMQEQGYTQAECSSEECAAEVGAMLGVQFMISGAIGKLGDTYTIDAKMFDVATGAAEKTINTTYTGKVDGLITEIEILAWEIMGIKAPITLLNKRMNNNIVDSGPTQKTPMGALIRSAVLPGWGQLYSDDRTMGWSFLGAELVLGTLALLSYSEYTSSHDDFDQYYNQYHTSLNPLEKQNYKEQAQSSHKSLSDANDQMTLMLYGLGTIWIANMVHAYMNGPTDNLSKRNLPDIDMVLNDFTKEPQLRLSWSLDK